MGPIIFWSSIELYVRETEFPDSVDLHRAETLKNHFIDCIAALTFSEQLQVKNFENVRKIIKKVADYRLFFFCHTE